MNELTKIRLRLSKLLVKLSEVPTDLGVLYKSEDGELVVGDLVYVTEESGAFIPAPTGDYKAEKVTYKVVDGKISEIVEETVEEPVKEELEDVPSPDGSEEAVPEAIVEIRKEVNELYDIVDKLVKKMEEIDSKIADNQTTIEKMSSMSAAKPAVEEIEKVSKSQSFKDIVNEAKKNFR